MKTIISKSGMWLMLAFVFASLLILLNLNLISRVDDFLSRQDFESFLNEKLTEFLRVDQASQGIEEPAVLADSPGQAAMQDYLNTLDPALKTVPKERLKQAFQYKRALEIENAYKSTENLQWQSTVSNFGGRTRAVMWDPNDPLYKKVWAGGVTGGLWYKEDITTSAPWVAVDDFWSGLSVSCMASDPNNPGTFYVGTGEAQTALIIYRESSGVGFGIQHSTDGGENWTVLPGTETFEYITDIEVRNEDGSSVIYAGVASGIYKGTIHQSTPSDGLWRSVAGSDTWEQVLPLIDGEDVPFVPADIEIGPDGRIFVGSMPNVEGFGGATILFSDEGESGTWTVNDEYRVLIENTPGFDLPGRVIMAAAPSDPERVYALVAQGFNYGLPAYECHIFARSYDKGVSWETASIPPDNGLTGNWAFIAWHALTAAVDPNDADRVYAGALNVYVTENAGDNWATRSTWTNTAAVNYVHADHHRILYEPGSSDKMLVVTDGGVFYTENASQSPVLFQETNAGFNTLQMYKVALHPDPGATFFLGGMQDNGTVYYDGNPIENANRITGGDGGACFIDKNEPGTLITSSQNNRFTFFSNGQVAGTAANWGSGNFISSVAYDYRQNILYANAVTVLNNLQDQVLRISGIPVPPYTGDFINMGTGSTVPFTHVLYSEYSPPSQTTLFLGTQSGRLFRVENAESTPDVSEIGSTAFPTASISCIAHGGSEDTLLVTFSNYGVSSVWQTYDGGMDWFEREGNLPDMPVRWALYHPDNAKAAMLATEIGIWTSYQLNEDNPVWTPDNEGLANVRIDMLQLREADYTVLAGTHGRGFFYTTFNYDPTTGLQHVLARDLEVTPNPTRGATTLRFSRANPSEVEYKLMNSTGAMVMAGTLQDPKPAVTLDLTSLPPGTYFIVITHDNQSTSRKIVKI